MSFRLIFNGHMGQLPVNIRQFLHGLGPWPTLASWRSASGSMTCLSRHMLTVLGHVQRRAFQGSTDPYKPKLKYMRSIYSLALPHFSSVCPLAGLHPPLLSYFSSLCCLSPFWYEEEAFLASSTYHIIACCCVIRTYVVLGAVKLEPPVGHDLPSMLQCTCEK
jgi:hypothetical protein